ncbi:hypothetical protein FRC20_009806 [Serendipita sp. 405]|nr:hypothetical protein FRC20_009806 [Serendipita sp. 405]
MFSIQAQLTTPLATSSRMSIPALFPLDQFSPTSLVFLLVLSPLSLLLYRYKRAVAMVSDLPGLRLIVSPMCALGLLLPRLPMPLRTYPGFSFPSELKHAGLFKLFKCDTVSLCGWLDGRAIIYTCDVPFLTRMASYAGSTIFPKPIEEYGVLGYFGDNVVIAERGNWRRQRKVSAPAFSSKMFERLWTDMASIVQDMFREENWEERTTKFTPSRGVRTDETGEYVPKEGEIYFPHVVDLTLRLALAAIARTGFGINFEWRSDESFTKSCASFGQPFSSRARGFVNRLLWDGIHLVFTKNFLHTVLSPRNPESEQSPNRSKLDAIRTNVRTKFHHWLVALEKNVRPQVEREMKIQEALHLVAKESTFKLAVSSLPSWVSKLPFRRLNRMNMAFDCLHAELQKMIAIRRCEIGMVLEGCPSESPSMSSSSLISDESGDSGISSSSTFGPELDLKEEGFDLLSNLVRSAMQTERVGGQSLSDDEIIGNAYIYLLAGHETTAHSLAWTLALLAAYPDEQEKAYREIMENDPSENTVIRDYPKFKFLLACYYETLRLFPPVQQIPKIAAEDTQILIEKSNDTTSAAPSAQPPSQAPTDLEVKERKEAGSIIQPQPAMHMKKPSFGSLPLSLSARRFRSLDSGHPVGLESVVGQHRRHKLPPITVPARSLSSIDFLYPTPPSLPSTPLPSPVRETLALPKLPGPMPAPARSEFVGPQPFVQLNKAGEGKEDFPLCPDADQQSVVIKKGTIVFISPPGVHYNPKYWDDPEAFMPDRFLKPFCRSAFIPFGVGARACLGRKFSEVESVCMLVHLLRNYSVHLPLLPGQTVEEARAKFSRASVRITLTPEKVPLIFRRRTQPATQQ